MGAPPTLWFLGLNQQRRIERQGGLIPSLTATDRHRRQRRFPAELFGRWLLWDRAALYSAGGVRRRNRIKFCQDTEVRACN